MTVVRGPRFVRDAKDNPVTSRDWPAPPANALPQLLASRPLTAMSTSAESSDSLLAAMSKVRIPVENHGFIRRFINAIGIAGIRAVDDSSKPHVVAKRRDGLPDLQIHYGFTNGFTSEQEIIDAAGSATVRRPSSRKGTWYVEHPTSKVRVGGERSRSVQRQAESCACGMQLSLTGVCASCD